MKKLFLFLILSFFCVVQAQNRIEISHPNVGFPYMETTDLSTRPVYKPKSGIPPIEVADTLLWNGDTLLFFVSPVYGMENFDKEVLFDTSVLWGGYWPVNSNFNVQNQCVATWKLVNDTLFLQKIEPMFGMGCLSNVRDSLWYMRNELDKRIEKYLGQKKGVNGFYIPMLRGEWRAVSGRVSKRHCKAEYLFMLRDGKVTSGIKYYISPFVMDDINVFCRYLSQNFTRWDCLDPNGNPIVLNIELSEKGKPQLSMYDSQTFTSVNIIKFRNKDLQKKNLIQNEIRNIVNQLPEESFSDYLIFGVGAGGLETSKKISLYLYFDPKAKTVGLW